MKLTARTCAISAALAVVIGLPLLFYALDDAPRRSLLKESISILTLLAFSMMLGQYFLARSNETLPSLFEPSQIQKVHKYIAYSAVAVMLLHPVLVVLPRHFEAGVKPWDALVTMLTTFDSLGILLGLAGPSINTDGGTLALMVLWFAIRALLRLAVYIFIGALILQAVLSWINPYSPLAAPAYQLTRPILDPIRRIIPTISGIDLSPLVAILLLQVVLMFL